MLRTSRHRPDYLVIGLGFLAGRFGVFSKADMRVLGTFVVKFALPALVFTALSQRPVGEVLKARYIVDYALGSIAVMAVAFAWGLWRQGMSFTLSALCGLGMSSSNSGFIGYPIAVQHDQRAAVAALGVAGLRDLSGRDRSMTACARRCRPHLSRTRGPSCALPERAGRPWPIGWGAGGAPCARSVHRLSRVFQ